MAGAQIDTSLAKEAFVAGTQNGIKPMNAAALQHVDQVCCCELTSDLHARCCSPPCFLAARGSVSPGERQDKERGR